MIDFTKNKPSDTILILKYRSEEFCWQYLDTALILRHRSSYCWQSVKKLVCIFNLIASSIWRFVCVISHKPFFSFSKWRNLQQSISLHSSFQPKHSIKSRHLSRMQQIKSYNLWNKRSNFEKKKSKKYWIVKISQREIRELHENNFNRINKIKFRELRRFLKKRGVWISQDNRISIARSLVNTLKEKISTIWSFDKIKLYNWEKKFIFNTMIEYLKSLIEKIPQFPSSSKLKNYRRRSSFFPNQQQQSKQSNRFQSEKRVESKSQQYTSSAF